MSTEHKLFKTTEVAEYLGSKVSYLHTLMMKKVIPYYKPSGMQCFFEQADLDTFLHGVRIASEDEVKLLPQNTKRAENGRQMRRVIVP